MATQSWSCTTQIQILLKAWVFAVCLCCFVLCSYRLSGGWIPHPGSSSTRLRVHTEGIISWLEQAVNVVEEEFLFSRYRTHMSYPLQQYGGSIMELCQTFVQMWLNRTSTIELFGRMPAWCEGWYMPEIYNSFTERSMFTNININIFGWSLANYVLICTLLTGINSDM